MQSDGFMRKWFKHFSAVLLSLSFFISASTTIGYLNDNLVQNLTHLYRLFTISASKAEVVIAQATPYFLIEKHALLLLVGLSVFFCIIAIYLEVLKIKKYKRNKKSAGIISIAASLIFYNIVFISFSGFQV